MYKIIFIGMIISFVVMNPVYAGKIYRWVDDEGKVTYRDKPPPTDAGDFKEVDIDVDRNVIKMKKPTPSGSTSSGSSGSQNNAGTDSTTQQKDSERFIPGAVGKGKVQAPAPLEPTGVTPPTSPEAPAPLAPTGVPGVTPPTPLTLPRGSS